MKHSITIPMPSAKLSPNARPHFMQRANLVKELRHRVAQLAKHYDFPRGDVESYQLHFTFPTKARRDYDNFTGRCKAALDGLSDYTGSDDGAWAMEAPTREITKGQNEVKITLTFKQ